MRIFYGHDDHILSAVNHQLDILLLKKKQTKFITSKEYKMLLDFKESYFINKTPLLNSSLNKVVCRTPKGLFFYSMNMVSNCRDKKLISYFHSDFEQSDNFELNICNILYEFYAGMKVTGTYSPDFEFIETYLEEEGMNVTQESFESLAKAMAYFDEVKAIAAKEKRIVKLEKKAGKKELTPHEWGQIIINICNEYNESAKPDDSPIFGTYCAYDLWPCFNKDDFTAAGLEKFKDEEYFKLCVLRARVIYMKREFPNIIQDDMVLFLKHLIRFWHSFRFFMKEWVISSKGFDYLTHKTPWFKLDHFDSLVLSKQVGFYTVNYIKWIREVVLVEHPELETASPEEVYMRMFEYYSAFEPLPEWWWENVSPNAFMVGFGESTFDPRIGQIVEYDYKGKVTIKFVNRKEVENAVTMGK